VYKYNIDFGIGVGIDFGDFESFDFVKVDCGALNLPVSMKLAAQPEPAL